MPPNKFYRWIKFLDRIKYFYRGELTHETHSQALRELADPNALKRRKIKQMHTTNNYVGTHPDIVKFWRIFHKDMEKRNIPIRAFEFKRSHDRQNELYKEGRSFAKGAVLRSGHRHVRARRPNLPRNTLHLRGARRERPPCRDGSRRGQPGPRAGHAAARRDARRQPRPRAHHAHRPPRGRAGPLRAGKDHHG